MMLLWPSAFKSLGECMFSSILDRYLGVKFLDHMVYLCLTF